MLLEGSCHCGAVKFTVQSHEPVPFMRCYCSICRKTAGTAGFAINLGAEHRTLQVTGRENLAVYQARLDEHQRSTGERNFCKLCGTALWLYDPTWPELVHPFASAVDTELPVPPATTHLMLKFKPAWVTPQIGADDLMFDLYPQESIEDWHRRHGLWVD